MKDLEPLDPVAKDFISEYVRNAWAIGKYYDLAFQKAISRHNLTKSEKDVLLFLYNNPEHKTASDIVEFRWISKSLVSKSVESLIQRGFLLGEPSQEDRRFITLSITKAAYPALEELLLAQKRFFISVQQAFTPTEYEQWLSLSHKMTSFLEESIEYYE